MNAYGIDSKPNILIKPSYNEITEIVHLTMGDMPKTANFACLNWQEDITNLLQSISWDLKINILIFYHPLIGLYIHFNAEYGVSGICT